MIRGLPNLHGAAIVAARGDAPYASIEDVWRRAGVPVAALERLAEADAFACFGIDRRQALWQVRGLAAAPLPLFAAVEGREPAVVLQPMTAGREVIEDYRALQLSLRAHPLSFLRAELTRRRIASCRDLDTMKDGARVEIAGIILIRQRPGEGNVIFITLEDETGVANIVVWSRMFETYRRTILSSAMLVVKGRVQREGMVIHVISERIDDATDLLRTVGQRDFPHRTGRGDGGAHPGAPDSRHPDDMLRQKTRDFR